MGDSAQARKRGREGVPDWPMGDDGRPIGPGDVVKMPGGSVVFVLTVAFADVNGAYVNGFWVGPDERVKVVKKRGMR